MGGSWDQRRVWEGVKTTNKSLRLVGGVEVQLEDGIKVHPQVIVTHG